MKRLFISNSGGETSGYMTRLLLTNWRHRYDEIVVGFANTSQENEQTLEFINRCDLEFGFNTVWLEAVVNDGRVGTSHRVVNFETASRNGEPFEEVIKKYGIPNQSWLHCTRELKLQPMLSYLNNIGWEFGSYEKAIGIRADESKRRSKKQAENNIVYPLMDWQPTTKPEVNKFWMAQPFRLELTGYQGNCKTCFKKGDPKLLTIMDENPRLFDFNERMERLYGRVGAEFEKEMPQGQARVFFRHNRSTLDMRKLYEEKKDCLDTVVDDSLLLPTADLFDGCSESCEVNFEEAA